MNYHAPTQRFTIAATNLEDFATHVRFAIRMIREAGGFPAAGGPRSFPMTSACHAEHAMLNACRSIGVELGASRAGELDVREAP